MSSRQSVAWLELRADRPQFPDPIRIEIKRSLFAASLFLSCNVEHTPRGERLVITGGATAKIPFKGNLTYSAESESSQNAPRTPLAFDRYLERDSSGTVTALYQAEGNKVRLSRGARASAGRDEKILEVSSACPTPVLSPLQLPVALADSWDDSIEEYRGYFVSGDKFRAIHLKKLRQEGQVAILQGRVSKAGDLGIQDWAKISFVSVTEFEISFDTSTRRIQSARFRAPVVGEIELLSDASTN